MLVEPIAEDSLQAPYTHVTEFSLYCPVPLVVSKWTAVCVKLCFRAWCNSPPLLVRCFLDVEAV